MKTAAIRCMRAALCPLLGGLIAASAGAAEPSLESWIRSQTLRSLDRVYQAISPTDGAVGSVFASPSRDNPNYYFHWVRDSALTMREVWAFRSLAPKRAKSTLMDYALFSGRNQSADNRTGGAYGRGLGEPKFELTGEGYAQDWGRPQSDGPALRVLALLGLADDLMLSGQTDFVYRHLYAAEMPARTVIKADLEYIAHYWPEPSFDLWEEVKGDHFYTRIVQWRALLEGARFAKRMGDPSAATYYAGEAKKVLRSLDGFWSNANGYLVATRNWVGGHPPSEKPSLLDIAVVLGVLHSGKSGAPFYVDDERVIATAHEIVRTFDAEYALNRAKRNEAGLLMAPAIGRYPEDQYTGHSTDGLGNPWFLATHAMAEYLLRLRGEIRAAGTVTITDLTRPFYESLLKQDLGLKRTYRESDPTFEAVLDALVLRSDAFVRRAKFHTGENGHQSEQFNRDRGFLQGARDLTWSYASFLSLRRIREDSRD